MSQSTCVKEVVGSKGMMTPFPFPSKDDIAAAENFEAQSGDVIIVTYPKCGTTWCQQLCHQIRTGGHIEFKEICDRGIVPWLELAPFMEFDLNEAHVGEPRCFKTHQRLAALSQFEARGAKYLCMLRDPEAAMLSQFKFQLSRGSLPPHIKDVNSYATWGFLPGAEGGGKWGGNIWDFYVEFWGCHTFPNVLLLVFEDMKKDLEGQVVRIAEFMGCTMTAESLAKVLEYGSFEWMSKNEHQFYGILEEVLKRKKGKGKGKGKEGEGKEGKENDGYQADAGFVMNASSTVGLQVDSSVDVKVSDATRELLAKAWTDVVLPKTGHASYKEMAKDLAQ